VPAPASLVGQTSVTGLDILRFQLLASFNLIRERVASVPDVAWNVPPVPGTNAVGFTMWHCARTIDWTVHTAVRGVSEVADDPRWGDRLARDALFGAGISRATADTVPGRVSRATLIEYLDALQPAMLDWLATQTPEALDAPVDLRGHQVGRPEYMSDPVWEEIASLDGIPAWQVLVRPSTSHIRVHMGEVDVLTELAHET
jgi:hypothetical protein